MNGWNSTFQPLFPSHLTIVTKPFLFPTGSKCLLKQLLSLQTRGPSEGLVGFIYLLRGMLLPGRFCVCVNAQGQGWVWASPTVLQSSKTCSTMKSSQEMVVEFLFVLQQSSKAQTSIYSLADTLHAHTHAQIYHKRQKEYMEVYTVHRDRLKTNPVAHFSHLFILHADHSAWCNWE